MQSDHTEDEPLLQPESHTKPCIVVLSEKTYHKNDFINDITDNNNDLHSMETGVTTHQGQGVTFINMPGMYDTAPDDVASVKGTITAYLRNQAAAFYSAFILVFVHPIRWTGQSQDFVHTFTDMVGEEMLKSNTFIVIADYKGQKKSFQDYITHVIKNYSFGNPGGGICELGDLFSIVSPDRIYSADDITSNIDKKSRFLANISDLQPAKVEAEETCNMQPAQVNNRVWDVPVIQMLLGVSCGFLFQVIVCVCVGITMVIVFIREKIPL